LSSVRPREAARRRLEESEDRIESVAEDSGFSNEEQMRCSFIRILGIPHSAGQSHHVDDRANLRLVDPPHDAGVAGRHHVDAVALAPCAPPPQAHRRDIATAAFDEAL
jgi:AraC-like DNA-binding protein